MHNIAGTKVRRHGDVAVTFYYRPVKRADESSPCPIFIFAKPGKFVSEQNLRIGNEDEPRLGAVYVPVSREGDEDSSLSF